jgi:nucleoside-diphosphate-sugar epimerase
MQYRVPKVVVLSSANVYGPRPDNAQFLTEEAPLLAAQAFPEMRDLVEIDHMASSFFWKARDIETVILRPVHILGSVHNAPSNYLRLPVIPTLLGFDPMVQVIHELDVAEAIAWSARARDESRGSHARRDFPDRDDARFLGHSMAYRQEGGPPRIEYLPVTITRWPPEARTY